MFSSAACKRKVRDAAHGTVTGRHSPRLGRGTESAFLYFPDIVRENRLWDP